MQIVPGSRLGPYEIVSRLGAGGMGEVWRGRDTRLERSVAIKILPQDLASDPKLRLRFEREAKAISQLNHPHICTLYDVGDEYLVMELLDGETLADRIERGPLPMADVLRYGNQIADALDRAHRAGIIHRDLKPGNIMITKSGAKLLDFGLARADQQKAIGHDHPTVHVRESLTEAGMIIGTFQYMSPEQLEGQRADARTDIFALGCVLYEMATGRPAFEGTGRMSLIAAIVSSQPKPISSLQPLAPQAFEHVVQKCLEKDPDGRWQSAHDVAEELSWIGKELEREVTTARVWRPRHWGAVAALAAVAIALGALWMRERAKPIQPVAFTIAGPSGGRIDSASLSQDGQYVAMTYSTDGGFALVVRKLGDLEPVRIKTVEATTAAVWSPDGKWIAYIEGGRLMRIPASGGQPETITTGLAYGMGTAWSEDNTILFSPRWGESLFRVPASGGKPEYVTKLDKTKSESLHAWPQFLPGGKDFLFVVHTIGENQNEIHVGSLDGRHSRLMDADSLVGYARSSILFVRDGAMYTQRFDAGSRKLEGEPRRIIDNVWFLETDAHAYATVARNGAISYFPTRTRVVRVSWHDRAGQFVATAFQEANIDDVRCSRDGTKVVFGKFDNTKGAPDLYTRDFARGVVTRITAGRATHIAGRWSPSGDRIYFTSDRSGVYDIYSQVEDGTAAPETVWRSAEDKTVNDISPDGRFLAAERYADRTRSDIWLVPLTTDGGGPRALITSEANEVRARWSPDGKWIAYVSNRSGRDHLYVRHFPAGRSVQVSTEPAVAYAWSRDGTALLYQNENRTVFACPLGADGDVARPGTPQRLFTLDDSVVEWAPSPIDDRFLFTSTAEGIDQVPLLSYVRKEW